MTFELLLAWESTGTFWFLISVLLAWIISVLLSRSSIIRSGNRILEFFIVFLPSFVFFIISLFDISIQLQYGGDFNPRTDLILARYGYGLLFQWLPTMMIMMLFLIHASRHDASSTTVVWMTSVQAFISLLFTPYPTNLTFLQAINKFILDSILNLISWVLVFLLTFFVMTSGDFFKNVKTTSNNNQFSLNFFLNATLSVVPTIIMVLIILLTSILDSIGLGLAWFLPGLFVFPLIVAVILGIILWVVMKSYAAIDEQNLFKIILEAKSRDLDKRITKETKSTPPPDDDGDDETHKIKKRVLRRHRERAMTISKYYLGALIILMGIGWLEDAITFDLAIFLTLFMGITGLVIIFLISMQPFSDYRIKDFLPSSGKSPKGKIAMMLLITIITSLTLVMIPAVGKLQELEQGNEALDYVSINERPLDEYPVILDNFRFVDKNLFLDLVESLKLPEPPKSFRVEVLEEHAAIGKIQDRPAWIVPLRYASALLNPDTNYIAGYIAMELDNPIPENIRIKYVEMSVGPGLTGLRDLARVVMEVAPDAMMSSTYYLIDPWTNGNPAWVVLLDRYTSWGVRIPDSVLIVHSDRTWERLSLQKALEMGIPGVISEDAMLSMVHSATKYLRGRQVDPSARGFLWLPPSPDVQENIEGLPFYYRPHHFLLGDKYLGRDLYLQVRTGSKESVVSWLRINDTIYSYDLRSYSKGGLVGVNTPDVVLKDLTSIAKEANIEQIDVRYPKLYRVTFGNATLLLWVSLLIQVQSGQDRFAGAVFIDAANSRIKGVVTARLGESPDTFKERFENAINQSYVGFLTGNETIGGETAVGIINNGTVTRKNWILLQPENQYAIVLYIQNKTNLVFVLVTEDSVATKEDFYVASILEEGDRVNIEARYDKDHQAWLAYKVNLLS